MRNITVNNQEWQFRIGKSNVLFQSPEGKKTAVGFDKVTGRSWYTIERGKHKGTTDGMVTPRHVASYIQKHLQKAK
jgi:hypothetical protein